MSILSAICHFVRIILFIARTPPTRSSTEHVFIYREMEQPKSGDVLYIDGGSACFQEKYYIRYC